jgi:hypothetical protein
MYHTEVLLADLGRHFDSLTANRALEQERRADCLKGRMAGR